MNSIKNIYRNFTLLKTIPESYWEQNLNMNQEIKIKKYDSGEIIHFDGDHCLSIDIILYGQVVIERIDDSGNLMVITEFNPDDVLGGNLLFSKNPCYPMMVTAKTQVTLLSITKPLIFELCANNKEFLRVYLEYISDHSLLLGDKLKHYVNRSIRDSIFAYLRSEYKVQNSQILQLRLTKKELADRIGVQRTSLSRELKKMKNEGLVEYDKSSISILNQNILQ